MPTKNQLIGAVTVVAVIIAWNQFIAPAIGAPRTN